MAKGAHYAIGGPDIWGNLNLVTVWLSPGGWEIQNGSLLTQAIKIIEETEKMGNKDLPPGEPLAWVQSDSSDSSCALLAADNTPSARAQQAEASDKLSGRQLTKSYSLSPALRTVPEPLRGRPDKGMSSWGTRRKCYLQARSQAALGEGLCARV